MFLPFPTDSIIVPPTKGKKMEFIISEMGWDKSCFQIIAEDTQIGLCALGVMPLNTQSPGL